MGLKKTLVYGIILLVVIIVGYVLVRPAASSSSSDAGTSTSKVKLIDTGYAPYAFLISGETVDNKAMRALAGFSRDRTLNADGSVTITLHALKTGYQDQQYTVPRGDSLYFIETSMGDDSVPDGEFNLGDDAGVLVDQDGYVVQ
ncbi:hypothetical protein HZA98_00430 [Candidatus Woesearchaeota archaeon]|nr:hypothetical protein [Candidatus Woesearchaeota archaeon]